MMKAKLALILSWQQTVVQISDIVRFNSGTSERPPRAISGEDTASRRKAR